MSEPITTVRTDELRPGDRVWHPFDIVCFTVTHKPKPETGLHFEGEPGLRVTGTNDRGETVHVDVAPAYKWHRAPITNVEDAVRAVGALPMPVGPEPQMPSEQRAAIAELIGDAKPATARLVEQLAKSVRDRREHEHPTWEDLYCLNLVSWMGERMGPVLRRLLDAEERIERRRARLAAAESDLLTVRGLLSPNGEPRRIPAEVEIHERVAPAVEWLLNRVTELEVAAIEGRAALAALCHDLDDPGSMALGALYLLQQATPGTPMEPGETVPKVYRASHDSIVMGLYTTREAAQDHCEKSACRSIVGDISLDWIEDEKDGVSELVFTRIDGVERTSGYVVTALEVASKYDEEADE